MTPGSREGCRHSPNVDRPTGRGLGWKLQSPVSGAPWRLGMRCPRCSADNLAGMEFCGRCGAPLDRPGLQEDVARRPFVPKPAAGLGIALPGEMEQVTVLFCDLVGSTPSPNGSGPRRCATSSARFWPPASPRCTATEAPRRNLPAMVSWRCSAPPSPRKTMSGARCWAAIAMPREQSDDTEYARPAVWRDLSSAPRLGLAPLSGSSHINRS